MIVLLAAQEAPIVVTGRALEDEAETPRTTLSAQDAAALASGRSEALVTRLPNLGTFRRADARSVHPTSQGLTLRGLGGNAASRVTLSIDGVPQADPFGGWLNFGALDPAQIDRLALVTGAIAEPGAVAGHLALDTRSRTPRIARAAWGGGDNWDLSHVDHLRIGKGFLQSTLGFLESDGFVPVVATDRGPADRSARAEQAGFRWRLVQPVAGIEAQAGLALFSDARDRGYDGSDNRARGLDLSLRLVERDGTLPFELTGWWQERDFETRFAALDDDRATTRIVLDQYDVPASGRGIKGRVDFGPVAIGAGWRGARARLAERFLFVDDEPTRERRAGGDNRILGLFAEQDRELGPARLAVSARIDHWRLGEGSRTVSDLADGVSLEDSRFAARDGTQWSGRASLSLDPFDTLSLVATAHRGWRLPTLNELYRPFRVGADATAANAGLDPETGHGVDVDVRWRRGPFDARATLFSQRLDHAITNVPLGSGPGQFPGVGFVGASGTYSQRLNIDGIDSRGLELDAGWTEGAFALRLLYGFADARVATSGPAAAFDGNRPAQAPRHSGSLLARWSDEGHALALTARLDGARYDDIENRVRLPATLSFDGTARARIDDRLVLELRAENLTDARILTDISGDGTRERARGRTLWLGVILTP